MGGSRHDSWLALALLTGCSVGGGEGEVGGHVVATDFCGLDNADYELHPSFFAAEVVEEQMTIRVQRGSDHQTYADGLLIHVRDVSEVKRQRIGLPIAITGEYRSLVQVVLYLNESCEAGFPSEHRRRAVLMEAVGGSITFRSIYAPDVEPAATGIEAVMTDVRFVDPETPDVRNATLGGTFAFFYQRGSPAQRFP